MILNLRLYATMSGSGSPALLVKLMTRASAFSACVPVPASDAGMIGEIRASFSSVRSNFVGLNEDDWQSFDSMIEQLGSGKNALHPSLSLAMSLACARAATGGELWRLRRDDASRFPYIAGIAARGKSWKEFLLIPRREHSISEAHGSLAEAWKVAGEELKAHGVLRGRTSTGAWVSDLEDTEMLYLLAQVAKDWNMGLGINACSGRLWNGSAYDYGKSAGRVMKSELSQEEQMSFLSAVMEHYGIEYIEDPFHPTDYVSHAQLSQKFEDAVVAGGEMYASDISKMKTAYRYRPGKAIAVDPWKLPTVSRLSGIREFAAGKGLGLCLSMFDDETEDSWISDLSVVFGADLLKLGVTGVASTSKYGRLLQIWEDADSPSMGKVRPG